MMDTVAKFIRAFKESANVQNAFWHFLKGREMPESFFNDVLERIYKTPEFRGELNEKLIKALGFDPEPFFIIFYCFTARSYSTKSGTGLWGDAWDAPRETKEYTYADMMKAFLFFIERGEFLAKEEFRTKTFLEKELVLLLDLQRVYDKYYEKIKEFVRIVEGYIYEKEKERIQKEKKEEAEKFIKGEGKLPFGVDSSGYAYLKNYFAAQFLLDEGLAEEVDGYIFLKKKVNLPKGEYYLSLKEVKDLLKD